MAKYKSKPQGTMGMAKYLKDHQRQLDSRKGQHRIPDESITVPQLVPEARPGYVPPITNLCTDPQPVNRLNWLPAAPTNTSADDTTYAGLNFRIDPAGLSYGAPFALPSTGHILGTGYDSMVPLTDDLVFAFNVRVAAQVSVYARLRVFDDAGTELLTASGDPALAAGCLVTQPGRTIDSSFSVLGNIGYVLPGDVTTRVWWGVDRDAVLALAPTAANVQVLFQSSHVSQPFTFVTTWLGEGSIYVGSDVDAFRDSDSPGWSLNDDGTSTGPAPQRIEWDEVDHPDIFPPSPHTHPSTDITDFDPAVEAIVDAAIAAIPPVIVPTSQFLPLTTTVGGVPELVWDANDELALTEVPLP